MVNLPFFCIGIFFSQFFVFGQRKKKVQPEDLPPAFSQPDATPLLGLLFWALCLVALLLWERLLATTRSQHVWPEHVRNTLGDLFKSAEAPSLRACRVGWSSESAIPSSWGKVYLSLTPLCGPSQFSCFEALEVICLISEATWFKLEVIWLSLEVKWFTPILF